MHSFMVCKTKRIVSVKMYVPSVGPNYEIIQTETWLFELTGAIGPTWLSAN